jgi:hypothetical protein
MTDFLTRLVQRSFEAPTAIRPRLPSLFEPESGPVSAVGSEPRRGDLARETTTEPDGQNPSIVASARYTPRPRAADRRNVTQIAIDVEAPASAPRSSCTSDSATAPAPVRHTPLRESAARVPRREEQHDSTSTESSKRSFGQTPTTTASLSPTKFGAAGGDGDLESRAVIASPKTIDNQERGLVVAPAISARIAAEMQADVLALAGIRGEGLKGGQQRSAWAAETRSEPNVHVSIGRVEVRATTDGGRSIKQRSASPVMTLDEYLRAQRGGK